MRFGGWKCILVDDSFIFERGLVFTLDVHTSPITSFYFSMVIGDVPLLRPTSSDFGSDPLNIHFSILIQLYGGPPFDTKDLV